MLFNYGSSFRLIRLYGRAFVRGMTARRVLNAIRTEWAYRRRQIDVRSKPYILFVEPLYYCNLRCPLCPRQSPEFHGQKGKIDLGLVDRVFEEVGPYLFQCSIFGNGEPTLDWTRTQAVVDVAKRHKVFTAVSTNATLITDEMATRIVTGGLDYLICAIDGVSQEAYETYRVGGQVADAMAGMQRVLEAKRRTGSRIFVEWQYLVHKQNEHELKAAKRLAKQVGVSIRFSSISGLGEDPERQKAWVADNPDYHGGLRTPGQPTKPHHCYWLWRSVYINATGTMARCPGYAGASLIGDLHSQSILDIYNGPTTQRQRQIFNPAPMPADAEVPAPCDTCTLYVRCHPPKPREPGRVVHSLGVIST